MKKYIPSLLILIGAYLFFNLLADVVKMRNRELKEKLQFATEACNEIYHLGKESANSLMLGDPEEYFELIERQKELLEAIK